MANQRNTKRALIMSALSLLLCISMLIGSTYAWFTDNVTSTGNTIQSGTLNVDLVDADGVTMEGKVIKFDAADKRDQDKILWEPGCTYETEPVYVVNKGSLALKYQILINGIDGDAKLLEAIEWTVTIDGVTTALADLNGALLAGETSKAIVLSGHMKEEAGNEYQGLTVNGISITVYATQLAHEEDSFDKYYDGATTWYGDIDTTWYNTTDTEFVIGTAEELAGLAAIVNGTANTNARATIQDDFAGKTIKLVSNINLNNINWTPIGSFEYDRDAQKYANYVVFRGNFDGQGYTINNLKIDAPTTEGVALFACAEAGTIQNLTMNNVNIVGGSHAGAILGRGGSAYGKKNTIINCHVTGDINIVVDWAYAGAIVGKANTLSISGCTVTPNGDGVITATNRNAVGSVLGWIEQPSTIANCKATNMKLTGWANIGSISGFLSQGTTMEGCYAENIVLTKTRELGHPTIGVFAGGFSYSANQAITIKDSTAKNITLNGTHIAAPASANILYGSEFGGNANSNFVLENNASENITNNLVEVTQVTNATELAAAVANGKINIYLADGEYNVANCGGKTLNLYGSKNAVLKVYNEGENGADYGFDGSTVTVNGVTVDTTANTGSYKGYARAKITYNDCAFVGGGYTTFNSCSFNNCTFDINGYIWTWGATEVNFTECTFIGDSRTILAHGGASTVITIKDCDFAATTKGHTGSGDWTAAVEIDPTGSNTYTINFEGENTLNENYSGWTRIKDGSTGHIVNGLN